MTFGSLFSGLGGMDLGLERAGWDCRWQVEIDPFCRRVLAKHWPDVPKHDDVRTFPPTEGDWIVDLIAGGFPCQDISCAGKRAGITGERSGLWYEFARTVRVLRPRFVVVENVSALLVRGLDVVLGSLAEIGYDAEWECLPAAAVGAPHIRDRVFILGYPHVSRPGAVPQGSSSRDAARQPGREPGDVADPERQGFERRGTAGDLAGPRLPAQREAQERQRRRDASFDRRPDVPDSDRQRLEVGPQRYFGPDRSGIAASLRDHADRCRGAYWPQAQPPVCGVVDGFPGRVDRLRGLGNAVVPQVAEWVGRRILESVKGGAA